MEDDDYSNNILKIIKSFDCLKIDDSYNENLKKKFDLLKVDYSNNENLKKKYKSWENKKNKLLTLKRKREIKYLNNKVEKNDEKLENNMKSKKYINITKVNASKSSEKNSIIKTKSQNNQSQIETKKIKSKDKINPVDLSEENNQKKNNLKEVNDKNINNNKQKKYFLKKDKNSFELSTIGFMNIGHTCYMNSFLQILFHIPSFLNKLKEYYKENCDNKNIIYYLIKLSEDPNDINILKCIKSLMGEINESYGEYIQNDSQEFGIDLINTIISLIKKDISSNDESEEQLNEEINMSNIIKIKKKKYEDYIKKYYPKENEIFLEDMFQFHEIKIKLELNDKIKAMDFETFLKIDLVFPPIYKNNNFTLEYLFNYRYFKFLLSNEEKKVQETVKKKDNILIKKKSDIISKNQKEKNFWENLKEISLNVFQNLNPFSNYNSKKNIKEDNIDINNFNKENNTSSNHKSSENIIYKKIVSLPKILIININRALIGKPLNLNPLIIQESLDIKNYIENDIINDSYTKYELFAINECKGFVKRFGHYYSYIKINREWFKFDDSNVERKKPNFCSKFVVGLYYIKNL